MFIDVVKNGQEGFERILKHADKEESGMIGVLLVCGPISIAGDIILEKGCYDFESQAYVKDNGGVSVCREFMKKLEGKNK